MPVDEHTRILIIGGTSGLGLAVARGAAERGAQVIIGSRSEQSVASALDVLPAGVEGRPVDATDPDSLAAFFREAGAIDHFVYTAGDHLRSPLLSDLTVDQSAHFFALRLVHAFDAVRQSVPYLRPRGSIVLTSGTAAFRGGAGWLLGAAVCGAMVSAVRSLAVELGPIRVNAVAPGVVRTPLWSQMEPQAREDMFAAVTRDVPLRQVADPDDIAPAYLALMEQDHVTGTVSLVDSGATLV